MNDFLLSGFALLELIVILTTVVFLVGLYRIPEKSSYKTWIQVYFWGLLLWHGVGFISGGIHSELREITYRYTNTLFNLGVAITLFAFIQIAYLSPSPLFKRERKYVLKIALVLSLAFFGSIFWFHFIQDQTDLNSFSYGPFVNLLAGLFGFLINLWTLSVFFRKFSVLNKLKSKDQIVPLLFGTSNLLLLFISFLFIYPGTGESFVLPTYIYGLWLILQGQIIVFIVYSPFPIQLEVKLVGFTFAGVMAILSITSMLLVAFTDNSDDALNMAQRIFDQSALKKLAFVIIGACGFILWIFPTILQASIIKPLEKLLEGIKKAESGDLFANVPVGMEDEIGIVTQNFNEMVNSLRVTDELLKENAATLQLKVEERTSELSKSLENLKKAQSQLIQSEKMVSMGELASGIAHEIQNPLNFVNNFSEVSEELIEEIIEEQGKDEKFRDVKLIEELIKDVSNNLHKIRRHGLQADGIVKNMLEHSRTGLGKKEWTDINALAKGFMNISYHSFLTKYRIEAETFKLINSTKLDKDLPKVQVIPQEIGKVLLNILNNAVYAVYHRMIKEKDNEYSPEITIETNLKTNSTGKNKILLSILDNGSGIPDSIKDKIFQPFFTTKPTGSGTGLGLSLSYDIVKAHGGELKVNSKEGEGTEFIIKLYLT